ncbi:tetratricopeptide repeat protein [Arcicella sp. LKC2W]|uniref:tetratricopeptide repeat protein n=1 Tax=Arcicella sp. LKC2W TaxID=2984198 RepID=UPI002B21EE46|nr:tetratricopeptide repeat protein [Arcicella sp. LKC2W]MEA5461059.1 tetratricopeptide repeat protein [Arcicella sp. LKC2W]
MINRSHSGKINKLFFNKEILVEDDLEENASLLKNSKKTIDRYLRDFDLYYTKTDTNTVSFDSIRISNIKQSAEYTYIKIYFKSNFSSLQKISGKAFPKSWRTLEIRADKIGKKWLTQIVRIGYDIAPKTIEELQLNDVILLPDVDATKVIDTLQIALSQEELKNLQEQQLQKLQTEFNQEQAQKEKEFRLILDEADKTLGQEDLKAAKILYANAQNLMPNMELRHITRQLRRITELQEEIQLRPEKLCREFIQKAKNAERLRKYTEAKNYLEKALEQKPDVDSLKRKIEKLNLNIRVLASIEAKITQNKNTEAESECNSEIDKLKNQEKNFKLFNNALYSDLLTWQAVSLAKQNKLKQAEDKFKKAIEKDANNSNAFRQRGLTYFQNTKYTEALADFKVYLSFDENNTTALTDLARCHFGIQDSTRGIQYFDKALELDKDNLALAFERAMIFHSWNKPKEAISAFTKLYSLNYNIANVLFYRASNFERLKQYSKSVIDFEQAIKFGISPEQVTLILKIAEKFYDDGKYYFESKSFPEAIERFGNATLFWKTHYDAWFYKGLSHIKLEQFSEAQKAFNHAIQIDDKQALAFYNRGIAKFLDEDFEESIPDFERAFQLSNELYQAAIYKGDAHLQLEQYSLAVEAFGYALMGEWTRKSANFTGLSILYGKRAAAFFNQKNYKDALKDFEECLKYNKNYGEGYYQRGKVYLAKGDFSNAINDFEKAIIMDYDKGKCYFAKAEAYRLNEKFGKAINDYTIALNREEWEENRADAHRQRAWCLVKEEKYFNAITDYEKNEELLAGKTSIDVKVELAIVYLKTDQNEEAKDILDIILQQKPSNPEALFAMGYYHFLTGNTDNAKKYLERVANTGVKKKELRESIIKPLWSNNKIKHLSETIIK